MIIKKIFLLKKFNLLQEDNIFLKNVRGLFTNYVSLFFIPPPSYSLKGRKKKRSLFPNNLFRIFCQKELLSKMWNWQKHYIQF